MVEFGVSLHVSSCSCTQTQIGSFTKNFQTDINKFFTYIAIKYALFYMELANYL